MKMNGFAGVLCFCAFFGVIQGSAIPMWEYLSKQEKTSYIYSLFANQVEKFCEGSPLPSCSRSLLKYGLGTLKNMAEEKLDAMDPYQRGANNIIEVKYPLPRIDDIFCKLHSGESYSKIDLSNAYNQLDLDDETSKILAWSTHKGIFKVNRLPFGVSPATAIFQRTLENLLQGLEG